MMITIRVMPGLAEAPTWRLVVLNAVCIGLVLLIALMPNRWWEQVRQALAWWPSNEWKVVGIALAVIVVVQAAALNWASISSLPGRILDTVRVTPPDRSHLLTRPVCESGDCPNFDFLVRDCERLAVQVGGLAMPPRDPDRRERLRFVPPNRESATAYFRGCLVDRGLSWFPCERGDPECRLLYPYRGTTLQSFVVE